MAKCLLICLVICTACEPVSGTDPELQKAATAALERENRGKSPPIPDMDVPGCDVCPVDCRWFDMRPVPLPVLLRDYRRAAVHFGKALREDKAWDRLVALGCVVKGHPSMHEPFLRFLDDEDEGVRYCAAVHALEHGLAREKPLAVLRAMAKSNSKLAQRTQIFVEDWEVGALQGL